jgi:hypothetical protein
MRIKSQPAGTSQRYDPAHFHPGQAAPPTENLNWAGRRAFSLDLLPFLSVMPSVDVARCRPAARRGVTDLEVAVVRPGR